MIDDAQLIPKLLAAGLINQTRLQEGLDLAKRNQATLYDVLIVNELVAENEMVQIASDVLNVASVDLSQSKIDAKVLELLPASLAMSSQTLPLELITDGDQKILRLAMVDPIDVMAMDEVASHIGVDIRPVLVGPRDLENALERLYEPSGEPEEEEESFYLEVPSAEEEEGEDSWAALFEDSEEEDLGEESAVISQEMRDRPPTDVFEVVDDDLLGDARFEREPLTNLVDEPSEGTHIGSPINLDEWDLDDAFYDSQSGGDAVELEEEEEEDEDDYASINDQTCIGLGMRGDLDDLDLDALAGDIDDESDAEKEPGEEVDHQSLEHSIEAALDIDDNAETSSSAEPSIIVEDLDVVAADDEQDEQDEQGEPEEEVAEKGNSKSPRVVPKSIRAALEKVSTRKEKRPSLKKSVAEEESPEKKSDNTPKPPPTLGRIKVKRIAVPAFKGAVEKRSDQSVELELAGENEVDEPTTREMSASDLVGLAMGAGDLNEHTESGGAAVEQLAHSLRQPAQQEQEETPSDALQLPDGVDDGLLLRGLLRLLVEKDLISPEEIQALAQKLVDEE